MKKPRQKNVSALNSIVPMGPAAKADRKTYKVTLGHLKKGRRHGKI
jgi:hypothetical protein